MEQAFTLLGQAAPAPAGGGLFTFLPFILMIVAMWFLVIAPQRKKQKKHQEMLSELKSGDQIVTNGGIYGTIVGVSDECFTVKIADGVKVDFLKSAIMNRQES